MSLLYVNFQVGIKHNCLINNISRKIISKKFRAIRLLSISNVINTNQKKKKGSKYRSTIKEPYSPFFRTLKGRKRSEHENRIKDLCNFSAKYNWQTQNYAAKEFILHDGPPYSNGKPHMGHAFNKILKDVIVRYKYLKGYKVNFEPGWDCHGLPIELKALEKSKKKGDIKGNWDNLAPLEIRQKAKSLAYETLDIQKRIFDKWGLFVDWSCHYNTNCQFYVAKEIELFGNLYEKGLIFQAFMPVHFSPSSKSSLAESELEYNENHESLYVYLALTVLDEYKDSICANISLPLYLCIWTTTPWSLPSNVTVCVNKVKEYLLIESSLNGRKIQLLWMKDLIEEFKNIFHSDFRITREIPGEALLNLCYSHPIYGHDCRVVSGSHVSHLKGTGLVHTAPSHGKEDFLTALKENLPTTLQLIDDKGYYKSEAGEDLAGKYVLKEGNEVVLNLIESNLSQRSPLILKTGKIVHSYPYDWRTKKPTIIRASRQWFFDIEKVKSNAIKALENVNIYPEKLRKSLVDQLDSRPYWCLSRQRVWGVPIPVFYDEETEEPIILRKNIEHLASLIKDEGPDVWWRYPEEKLLSPSYVEDLKKRGKNLPKKGRDIIDIWFDSGCSWYCAMDRKQSDLYVEGYDQINGWFQSSLLISVAATGISPYKTLLIHGFTIDENKQKMSKSLGNVFDPVIITEGGKDLSKDPVWGVNVLRWWAINGNPFNDRQLGPKMLATSENDIHSLVSVIWYLLAWFKDFDLDKLIPYEELRITDKYVLHQTKIYMDQIWKTYETFNNEEVCSKINHFVSNFIGGQYASSAKDILTCGHTSDHDRICIQTTFFHILPFILYSIAPIVPLIAEEAALHYPVKECGLFHQNRLNIEPPSQWDQSKIAQNFEKLFQIKETITDKCSEGINTITKSVLIKYTKDYEFLRDLQPLNKDQHSQLSAFLSVSEVTLELCTGDYSNEIFVEVSDATLNLCERCRKYTAQEEVCSRCQRVLSLING